MADKFGLPESFVLSNVHFHGIIGRGAYSSVEKVTVPVEAVAKKISTRDQEKRLLKECDIMSNLHHRNIVQFIGVCTASNQLALVMEQMLTSLHDLLQPPDGSADALSFFNVPLKCSVLHDIASGLDYLHKQSPRIVHRNLSAKNLLLNSMMVTKIADLGEARRLEAGNLMTTMTPGTIHYMPPEALEQSSKYDASIDIFSFGIVTIFTIGEKYPENCKSATYTEDKELKPRSEYERRIDFMKNVFEKLPSTPSGEQAHPLILLIQQCLQNAPKDRLDITQVLQLLEEARAGVRDGDNETNKRKLVKALQNQPKNQVRERIGKFTPTHVSKMQKCLTLIQHESLKFVVFLSH